MAVEHGPPRPPGSGPAAGSHRSGGSARRAPQTGAQSVERTFDLLELVAAQPEACSLTELAAAADLPVTTVHRLIKTLVSRSYVRQNSSRRYTLGPRLVALGQNAQIAVGHWSHPFLKEVVDLTGETANLAVLDGSDVLYVAQVSSTRHTLRLFTEVGRRATPHSTADGKVLLALMPESFVEELARSSGLVKHTESTITEVESLMAELDSVRRLGYAVDDEENDLGVRCFAVPVMPGGNFALSMSGPSRRLTYDVGVALISRVSEIASRLGESLAVPAG
jgi:IclR family acetate operon transcriptional repressor